MYSSNQFGNASKTTKLKTNSNRNKTTTKKSKTTTTPKLLKSTINRPTTIASSFPKPKQGKTTSGSHLTPHQTLSSEIEQQLSIAFLKPTSKSKISYKDKLKNTAALPTLPAGIKRYSTADPLVFTRADRVMVGMSVVEFLDWVKAKEGRRKEIDEKIERDFEVMKEKRKGGREEKLGRVGWVGDEEDREEVVGDLRSEGYKLPVWRDKLEVFFE